jgi:heme/copper-type cytochrome/quinol oxidase subunit 2
MVKRLAKGFGFWVLVVAVALVMGVSFTRGDQATVAAPTWKEHWDVASIIIVILFGYFVWSARHKLNCIDKKFGALFRWKENTDLRLTVLETEHNLRTGHDCHPRRRTGDMAEEADGG